MLHVQPQIILFHFLIFFLSKYASFVGAFFMFYLSSYFLIGAKFCRIVLFLISPSRLLFGHQYSVTVLKAAAFASVYRR